MQRYYTRACNFFYGEKSKSLVNLKKSLPICGKKEISFDHIEIISRKNVKKISITEINKLPKNIRLKVRKDINNITKKIKNFSNLNFSSPYILMGILNITPDSFSDGGKYLKKNKAMSQLKKMFSEGADLVDIGGESTRPGSKAVKTKVEWERIKPILKDINKRKIISVDTRKAEIMEKSIFMGANIINDVSGLSFDTETVKILKKYKVPFVLQHSSGMPEVMQKNPKYKDVVLDIYDFFVKKINFLRKKGIKHNKIILDPGIGFGKNLKHNLKILKNISVYHCLGFPILLGTSRKKFIKDISKVNDSSDRLGGTLSSCIFSLMQGVQILRIHDVNEIKQGIKVFRELIN